MIGPYAIAQLVHNFPPEIRQIAELRLISVLRLCGMRA